MRTRDTDTTGITGTTTGRTTRRTGTGTGTRATRHADRPDPAQAHGPAQGPAHGPAQDLTSADAPATAPASVPVPPLLALQATAGNAAVVRMLQRRTADGPAQHEAIGSPAQHEAGADEKNRTAPAPRSAVHDVLRRAGRPLDAAVRADMEARLGADFSDVRIHDDSAARASAAEVGARAYTSGTHVVLGTGGTDRHTLAHELTHVVQQRRGPVAGTDNGAGLRVSDPSDRFEREAEANAARALAAPPPQYGHTDQPGRAGTGTGTGGHRADTAVQRTPSFGLRSRRGQQSTAAPAGIDRDTTLDRLRNYGDWHRRWIEDYVSVFDEVRATVPTFMSTSEDLQTAAQELHAEYLKRTGRTIENSPLAPVIRYLLHGGESVPGLGGLGSLHVEGDRLDGRPNFAVATQKALPLKPNQHRRHITAWHNIRAILNAAYDQHGRQLIPYLTAKLGPGFVDAGMANEVTGSLDRMPAGQFGDVDPAHARLLMAAAHVMNSSVKNLWVGGGAENSEINRASIYVQQALAALTPANLAATRAKLAAYGVTSGKGTNVMARVVARFDEKIAEAPTHDDPQQLVEQLKESVLREDVRELEVDAPDAAGRSATTDTALTVAHAVFDAILRNPSGAISFDRITTTVDFLWTS